MTQLEAYIKFVETVKATHVVLHGQDRPGNVDQCSIAKAFKELEDNLK